MRGGGWVLGVFVDVFEVIEGEGELYVEEVVILVRVFLFEDDCFVFDVEGVLVEFIL